MNFMKKYTYVLLLFSMLLVFVLVHSGCSNGDKSSPTYEPTENVEPNSLKSDYATQEPEKLESAAPDYAMQEPEKSESETSEHTEEVLEIAGTKFSADEAEAWLNNIFEEDYKILYLPGNNKWEENVLHYAFLLDYSDWVSYSVGEPVVYVWVNSVTGEITSIEEKELYANIPDLMFPVPMLNGEVIPYDYFTLPGYAWTGGYRFLDRSVLEIYKNQLREAGFVEHGEVMSADSLWTYERDTDGATLMVEIFYGEEGSFSICMSVNHIDR
jgi:hypothetical protein